MALTFSGFPAFFVHISMNLPDAATDVVSIVKNCIANGKIGIGWSYWSDEQILSTAPEYTQLQNLQSDWYLRHFNATTNYNPQKQHIAARNALQRLMSMRIGTPVIANLPGSGLFGLGLTASTYNSKDTPLSHKDGGFFRTIDVSWTKLVAPVIEGKPVCTEVNWKQIHTTYIPSSTITHLPQTVYEQMVKLLLAKYGQ